METDSQIRFLDPVPLVHSRVRSWNIRTIQSKDVQNVKTLNERWLGSSFAKSFYLQFLYDSSATCVIAEDFEGQIIGCGTAKVVLRDASSSHEGEGHVLTLAVDPSFRRRGIGRDILEALLIQIRTICTRLSQQKGQTIVLKSVVLQTSTSNLVALKFYEVCGYQRQALKAGYYGGGKDAIWMRLSLTEDVAKNKLSGQQMVRSASGTNWVPVY